MFLVTGGTNGTDHIDSTEIFDPDLGSWRVGATLTSPMRGMTAVNIDNRVLILGIYQHLTWWHHVIYILILTGGFDGNDKVDTVLEYDFTDNSFTELGTMEEARQDHAVSVVKHSDVSMLCEWFFDGQVYRWDHETFLLSELICGTPPSRVLTEKRKKKLRL